MTPLSVAFIGAGDIAGGFDERKNRNDDGVYTHAGAFRQCGTFLLETVLDTNVANAQKFADFWAIENKTGSLDEILDGHHDVVCVCSPDDTHADIVQKLLLSRCCKTIVVEKPLATNLNDLSKIELLAQESGINVVVNFQRRHELVHQELREFISKDESLLMSASGRYMKGLDHVGITMVDTLCFLLGLPDEVMAFDRVWNKQVNDYSYEFVLFYPACSVSIQTIDSSNIDYAYHHFEIDLLFADRRNTLIDMSQAVREVDVTEYAYAGVKVTNDRKANVTMTGYNRSMVNAAEYVANVTHGKVKHTINTVQNSYNNQLILNNIVASYNSSCKKIRIEPKQWKR